MEWLDDKLHPQLRLDHADIEVTYQPVALDEGPGPDIVMFKAESVAHHSVTGKLVYTAHDLSFMPSVFLEFADALRAVLDGAAREAKLSPVGRELVVTVDRVGKDVRMHVEISEWQSSYPETTASMWGGVGPDIAYRWALDLSAYVGRMREWVMERAVR